MIAAFIAIASHNPLANPGPLAMPPAVNAPAKSESTNPIFLFRFGLELHGRWKIFSSMNKSHIKAVRTTVGISVKARYLEAMICPAAWKDIRAIAMSFIHFVGSLSGFGLTASIWQRTAAMRRRMVCTAKERIMVTRRRGPRSREQETKQKLPRRNAPTAIRAFIHKYSGLSGLSDAPRASRMMFPVQYISC